MSREASGVVPARLPRGTGGDEFTLTKETEMTRVYVTGPTNGLPEYNYPAFAEAKRRLMEAGYDVVSPHDVDVLCKGATVMHPAGLTRDLEFLFLHLPLHHACPTESTAIWQWYMRRALIQMLCCDTVARLPCTAEQAEGSRGMQVELRLAAELGMRLVTLEILVQEGLRQIETPVLLSDDYQPTTFTG